MAATIQEILKPTKYRAVDTSTSIQETVDIVLDGGFDTGVLEGATGTYWACADDWVISGSSATCTNDDGTSANLTQATTAGLLKGGETYRVTYTLSSYSSAGDAGRIRIILFSGSPSSDGKYYQGIGAQRGPVSGSVTYTEDITIDNGNGDGPNRITFQTLVDPITVTLDTLSVVKLESFGNNNHGQIYSGRALEFDGVSDNLEIDASEVEGRTLFTASPFTTSFWFYLNGIAGSSSYIIGTSDGASPHVFGIRVQSAHLTFWTRFQTPKNYFGYTEDGVGYLPGGSADDAMGRDAAGLLKTWVRVALVNTLDGNRTMKLYINGELWGYIDKDTRRLYGQGGVGTTQILSETNDLHRLGAVGAPYSNNANAFDGMISDFQIWDTAWTASDATFDYLNPESLALNNGGTSLTESNLKIWYPMQDGHRGQQSNIMDGANTGLGLELATNGDLSSGTTGYTLDNDGGGTSVEVSTEQTYGGNSQSLKYVVVGSGDGLSASITGKYIEGVLYKVSAWIYTSNTLSVNPDNSYFFNANNIVNSTKTNEWEEVVCYMTCEDNSGVNPTDALYIQTANSGTTTFYLGQLSIKPVNDKHPATTVFYGDNQDWDDNHFTIAQDTAFGANVDGTVMEFDVNDSSLGCDGDLGAEHIWDSNNVDINVSNGNWAAYGTGASLEVWDAAAGDGNGGLTINPNGGPVDQGLTLPIANMTTLIAGTSYLVSADIKCGTAGNNKFDFFIKLGGVECDDFDTTTSFVTYERIITVIEDSDLVIANRNEDGAEWYLDNISVKPIDSGWIICKDTGVDTASALSNSGGTFKIINSATDDPARILLPITVVKGKSYRVEAKSAAGEVKICLSNTLSTDSSISQTFGEDFDVGDVGYSTDVFAKGTTMGIYVQNTINTDTQYIRIDNVKIVEVGTASGWTDADQQLDIPQTALQSYNQLAWFNGATDEYRSSGSGILPPSQNVTLSFWYLPVKERMGGSSHGLFEWQSYQNDNFRVLYTSTGLINFELSNDAFTVSSGNKILTLQSRVIPELTTAGFTGEWLHIVCVMNATHFRIHVNGEKVNETAGTLKVNSADYVARHSGVATMGLISRDLYFGIGSGLTYGRQMGCFNEMAYFDDYFSNAEVTELYNDGKALDARDHSASGNLFRYWKNNGLADCPNLSEIGSETLEVDSDETLLIPAGVDTSRDNQGFLMNRQKDTNSLNLPLDASDDYAASGVLIPRAHDVDATDFDADGDGTGDFTVEFWFKFVTAPASGSACMFTNIYRDAAGTPNYAGFEFLIGNDGNLDGVVTFDDAWANLDTLYSNLSGFNDGEWHHFVAVFDRSAYFHLIIDKVVKSEEVINTIDGDDKTSKSLWKFPIAIGGEKIAKKGHGVGRHGFTGAIDDLKIYNRLLTFETDGGVAADGDIDAGEDVTSGEVIRNYNAGKRSHR